MSYTVYTWDHEEQRWDVYQSGVSRFGLRNVLRSLRGDRRSWSDYTINVCRDDLEPDVAYDRDDAREARQFQIQCNQVEREAVMSEHPLFAGLEQP